ncbi:MAG: exosortase/archaeosortase family protein [Bacteroidetes bacterium]|nr:exosortase/archaeosortase family protein [Bacteroidota bacterium]
MDRNYLSTKYPQITSFLIDRKWRQVRGVALFCLITILIHVFWRFWANRLNYFPLGDIMEKANEVVAQWIFAQSLWIITNILHINVKIAPGSVLWLDNHCGIVINPSCSGLKPIIQFIILMLLFPGSWKRKLWYIPLGIALIYLTNLVRVSSMAITGALIPDILKFTHDYILRPMFYVVIFGLWWFWQEKIGYPPSMKEIDTKESG